MSFDPDFGQTLVDEEDLDSLTEQVRSVLGDPVRKGAAEDYCGRIATRDSTWALTWL